MHSIVENTFKSCLSVTGKISRPAKAFKKEAGSRKLDCLIINHQIHFGQADNIIRNEGILLVAKALFNYILSTQSGVLSSIINEWNLNSGKQLVRETLWDMNEC